MERIIAHWKETGRWWQGEPEREFKRYLDNGGVIREAMRELKPLSTRAFSAQTENQEKAHTVDYEVLKREAKDAREMLIKMKAEQMRSKNSAFVPLHSISAYSFGRSSLYPEEIATYAFAGGMSAVAMVDRFSLAGSVTFARACKQTGVKPIIGASVEMEDGGELVLLIENQKGWKNLCRLLSVCHLDEPRLFPLCNWKRLQSHAEGLVCLSGGHYGPINQALMCGRSDEARQALQKLQSVFGRSHLFVEIERSFAPWEKHVNKKLIEIAREQQIQLVACGISTHAKKEDFAVQDALLCAETLCTVEEIIGRKPQRHETQKAVSEKPLRWINSERFFKSGREWERLFSDLPECIANTMAVAERFPDEPLPPRPPFPKFDEHPEHTLRSVVFQGANEKYKHITKPILSRLSGELRRINELGYASHFLAMWEACHWAKSKGMLYSARGSVVDSAVAFCLGLSRVDALKHDLHFDRFLPPDGSKRPDIDIDFEFRKRDDVREFFKQRYGEDKVAGISAIPTYQGRGIVRMIGKALMIPEQAIDYLAKRLHGSVSGRRMEDAIKARPELRDSGIPAERFLLLFDLASRIDGLPRGMATHSSGLIISSEPICETAPIMQAAIPNVPIIQWDKYSAKYFFDKYDVLCLRGQDVLAGTGHDTELISMEEPAVYDKFQQGDLIGIPQSASPAMRQAHIRLRTANLHDASLVQAGIRPGVGGAVKINALIKRRRGIEKYVYPHPLFEEILGLSYGIIVFQEQVDQLLQAFCGYTAGEAEEIREKIHKYRAQDWGQTVHDPIVSRCLEKGFSLEIAEHVFELVSGFRGYGFAQGHALAFAEISIRCVYCMEKYPSEYFAALLSAQPAGYYGPATIANEARHKGVAILGPCVNHSDNISKAHANDIRVGLHQIFALSENTRERILQHKPYRNLVDFCSKIRPNSNEIESLILCGALDSFCTNRRAMLWAIPELIAVAQSVKNQYELYGQSEITLPETPDFTPYEKAVLERAMLNMDVKTHLMAFERSRVKEKGALTCKEAMKLNDGDEAYVVGLAMRLRFPPTASGRRIVFFDLEDETALLNVTCFDETYQRDGHTIICSPFVTLQGVAQERDGHMAFLANRVFPFQLSNNQNEFAQERKAVHAEDFIMRKGR